MIAEICCFNLFGLAFASLKTLISGTEAIVALTYIYSKYNNKNNKNNNKNNNRDDANDK